MPSLVSADLRLTRARNLHTLGESLLRHLETHNTNLVPMQRRHSLLKSLIDIKRNRDAYDFGPTQLKLLDVLIRKSRTRMTLEDLQTMHRLTCSLGLKKH